MIDEIEEMMVEIYKMISDDFKKFSDGTARKKEYMGDLIVAKARNLKDCDLIFTDLSIKFRMSKDPEYGIVKVSFRTSYYGEYKISVGDVTLFDTLIIIGLNREKNVIEKVFVIPEKDLIGKRFITVTNTTVSYKKFEVDKKIYAQVYDGMKTGNIPTLEGFIITKQDSCKNNIDINNWDNNN